MAHAPLSGRRNLLITSALPYVNNVPHLGNIIGCVLSADVYARFARLRGYNVLYVCGTDEYGTATETRALKEGISPKELCDKYHSVHKQVYQWFDIQFDQFGRTSTQMQTRIAQDIFEKCDRNGLVVEDEVEQLYCEACARFLADRYVSGICPDCGYDDARGDQCDSCGHLLNAVDLKEPKCTVCSKTPAVLKSKHLFLDLPNIAKPLTEFIEQQSVDGKWTSNSTSVSKSWLSNGLKPRCITRDLKWGTPVPRKGYEEKVFYVWFDAPIGYISITAAYTDEWEKWWKANRSGSEKVELYQFMGKDNIPFHTVIFPSTLIAANEGYTLLHHISTTEYLNYETGKFSKSRNTGVFGDTVQESGIPSEVWRYYLLANRPENSDTVFLWKDFQAKNNDELLKNVGNFVNRGLKFLKNEFAGVTPKIELNEDDQKYIDEANKLVNEYIQALEDVKIKSALKSAMALSSLGNQYLQHNKPWDLVKNEETKARGGSVTAFAANLVITLITLLEPYMPSFTQKVLDQLKLDKSLLTLQDAQFKILLPVGHEIGDPQPLFAKIDDAKITELRSKYDGSGEGESKEESGVEAAFPLELIVGKVVEVSAHPSAEHLYVLDVSFGDTTRKIVSGLVKHYAVDKLLNRFVIVVSNLKAANFKGVKSHGMVLCAQSGDEMGILTLPESNSSLIGSRVLPADIASSGNEKYSLLDSKKLKSALKNARFSVDSNNCVYSQTSPLLALSNAVIAEKVSSGAQIV